jgi:hypothetical protein
MRRTWNVDRQGSQSLFQSGTAWLIGSIVAVFLLGWFFSGTVPNPVWSNLAYDETLTKTWTLFTYPYGSPMENLFWFFIGCFILAQFASSLERETGPWGIIAMFFTYTLIGGVVYYIGTLIAGSATPIKPWLDLPDAFIFVTWAARNRTATVMFMFVIPIRAHWLAVISVGFVLVEYGYAVPLVGIVTAASLGVAWLYGLEKIPWLKFGDVPNLAPKQQEKKENKEFDRFMGDVKRREQERAEKERLRRLFESSLSDDDQDKKDG